MTVKISLTSRCRSRGPTWTDEEVRKLFLVWSQPDIFKGFQNEKRKREVFHQVSAELSKLNVTRSWAECKAKIKNLKGEYRKAREANAPHTFKYYTLMDKVLEGTCGSSPSKAGIPTTIISAESSHGSRPQNLEFQIIPASDIEFHGELVHPEETVIVPSTVTTATLEHVTVPHEVSVAHSGHSEVRAVDAESGAQVIVITSEPLTVHHEGSASTSAAAAFASNKPSPFKDSHNSLGKRPRKHSTTEVNQKRKKLHNLSEKMAETVERVLTKTTETLLAEFKASEERFFEWEEKKRLEELEKEEKLVKSLVDALSNRPSEEELRKKESVEKDKEAEERQRIMNMIQASDDPCAVTFDLLATRLTNMLTDQQKEMEQALFQWESKMQKKEMKHSENIFNMILNAVKSQSNDDLGQ